MEIDYNKLSRNYKEYPITQKEQLLYEDVYYLFWELNLTKQQVAQILGCSSTRIYKFAKQNNLVKTQQMITESQTNLCREKYGVNNPMQIESIKNKCIDRMQQTFKQNLKEINEKKKRTFRKKYGCDNPSQNLEIKKKKEQTVLKHYGYKHVTQCKEIQQKIKQTCIERYGDNPLGVNSNLKQKIEQSNIQKFGCKNPMQNKAIAQKTSKSLKENQEIYKQSNLEKYGVQWPAQLENIKKQIIDTKRKNNTFCSSKPEDDIYELLSKKYEVKRQYRSELYPFACDFYLPEKDLYIEYNGCWTHGKEPFISSPQQQKELTKWQEKAKTSKFYKNAIYTWTELDVRKQQTAKNNNLNYLAFYSFDDFLNWYCEVICQ